jgi:hypothetical protein
MSKYKSASELRAVLRELAIAEKKIGAARERINKIVGPKRQKNQKPEDEENQEHPYRTKIRRWRKPPGSRGFVNR